jgi:hypothetical protein
VCWRGLKRRLARLDGRSPKVAAVGAEDAMEAADLSK